MLRYPADLNRFHEAFYADAHVRARNGEPYVAPQRTIDATPSPGYIGTFRVSGTNITKLSEASQV